MYALEKAGVPKNKKEAYPVLVRQTVQANALSQCLGYPDKDSVLTVLERRVILYLFSLVDEKDCDFYYSEMKILDLARHAGMEGFKGGENRKQFREMLIRLSQKEFLLRTTPDTFTPLKWIDPPYFESDKGRGYVRLKIHDDLRPYLLNLKQIGRTIFYYGYSLKLTHKHSIDLYLLLKSAQGLGYWVMRIEHLNLLLGNSYGRFSDIQRYVLIPCIQEIKTVTDLDIDYHVRREHKKVKQIVFIIR